MGGTYVIVNSGKLDIVLAFFFLDDGQNFLQESDCLFIISQLLIDKGECQ
jgi:hypothetical protein